MTKEPICVENGGAICSGCLRCSPEPVEPAVDFKCQICGVDCAIAPPLPERPYCPDHCPDHDYKYDPWRRTKVCTICDVEAPDDYDADGPEYYTE